MAWPAHFWTLGDDPGQWDPDLEPGRFLSGYGHAFLELYVRTRARGLPVTLGRWPAPGTRVVLASLEELALWRRRLAPSAAARLAVAALRCPTVILIRGDLPLAIAAPRYVQLEVMPTEQAVVMPGRQLTLPLLPQRGLVQRRRERGDRIERVALKSYRHNLPDFVLDPSFAARLGELGVELRVETESEGSQRWHDFSDVDVALCVRRSLPEFDTDNAALRKPATKLINAWCAGVVAIVGRESAYLELVAPEHDALIASDAEEVISAIQRLRRDPRLVRKLRTTGEARAADFSVDAVLDRWERLLGSELPRGSRVTATASAIVYAAQAVGDRLRGGPA